MTDAPETIWARADPYEPDWTGDKTLRSKAHVKYRRADLVAPATLPMPPTLSSAMELPEVLALVEALQACEAEIDQYIRQEYPADHPVHERYRQRDFGANPARIALAQLKEPKQ